MFLHGVCARVRVRQRDEERWRMLVCCVRAHKSTYTTPAHLLRMRSRSFSQGSRGRFQNGASGKTAAVVVAVCGACGVRCVVRWVGRVAGRGLCTEEGCSCMHARATVCGTQHHAHVRTRTREKAHAQREDKQRDSDIARTTQAGPKHTAAPACTACTR